MRSGRRRRSSTPATPWREQPESIATTMLAMSQSSHPTAGRYWLGALVLLVVLGPVDTPAEIAAGVNGVAQTAEFSATFTLQRFNVEEGRLVAEGTLTDIPPVAGQTTTLGLVGVAIAGMSRSCEMVHVDFAPLDVNVQGTVMHLNDFAIHVSDPGTGPLRQTLCALSNAPNDVMVLRPLLNELIDLVGCLMRGSETCSRQAA